MSPMRSLRLAIDFLVVTAFLLLAFFPWSAFLSSKVSIMHQLEWPSAAHWLGTDNLGRDLLIRLSDAVTFAVLPLWLGIITLSIVGTAVAILFLSSVSKNSRLQTLTDIVLSGAASIPVAMFAFLFAVVFESSHLWMVILSVGFILSIHSFLFIRGLYLKSEKLGYWQAHAATGGRRRSRIVRYGVFSHWKHDILGNMTFYLKVGITVEAGLSYLGFGVQEPHPSFGNILASHFDSYLRGNWFVLAITAAGFVLCAYFPAAVFNVGRFVTSLTARPKAYFFPNLFKYQNN